MTVPSHERVGQRFNWLTVLAVVGARFLVRCDCGDERLVLKSNVIGGGVKSCSSCGRERQRRAVAVHGGSETPEYSTWAGMIQRCTNPNDRGFKNYGGRGIRVCSRWAESFEAFREDMGPRPAGMSIDRIDVNGHYEPGNCRWATQVQQARNTRRNVWLEHDGRRMLACDWAAELGISRQRMEQRMRARLPPERLFAKGADGSAGCRRIQHRVETMHARQSVETARVSRGATFAQLRVLQAFADIQATLGYPPSMREVGDRCGIRSTNGITEAYERLARRGLLNYERNLGSAGAQSRRITLTDLGKQALAILPTGTIDEGSRCSTCGAHVFSPERHQCIEQEHTHD